jgi:hypothetical protein
MAAAANSALSGGPTPTRHFRGTGIVSLDQPAVEEPDAETIELLTYLASPNSIMREAFEAGLIEKSNQIFSENFSRAKNLSERTEMVLTTLLASVATDVPLEITPTTRKLVVEAINLAKAKHPSFLFQDFTQFPQGLNDHLIKWLVAHHRSKKYQVGIAHKDLHQLLGFIPAITLREWAFKRKERLTMEFGTPDLRGPTGAEALPPQGTFKREDYRGLQEELSTMAAERREVTAREARGLAIGSIRNQLDTVYYAGPGNVNELTSQASTSLLREQSRNRILGLLREVSELRENTVISVGTDNVSTTISRKSRGVDPKLSATHHRFKVIVPIKNTVSMYDVGLTWCPRIFNPFMDLRQAVRDVYNAAFREYKQQYYVPEPVKPHIVWERYTVSKDVNMEGEEYVSEWFHIVLASVERETKPDLNGASVVWNQDEDWLNDDPDTWAIWLANLSFSGQTISGRVIAETTDGGADFQGYARITVPILRYSTETVNNLAQYEADLTDYNLKIQALEASASQYAKIKQREFIERHQRQDPITKIVFEVLVKRVCQNIPAQHLSYYKEIISRCIDWSETKIEFESRAIDSLLYPDFPPDHFMNSPAVRFFLPVIRTAEDVLFDVLAEFGSFFTRQGVENARDRIKNMRDDINNNGPTELDTFDSKLTIGEHIEGVMSNHDLVRQ